MTTHPTIVIAPNASLAATILLSLLDTLETNLATPQEVHPNG